ncbi:unnamed protein product [Polarella glacialis]|uniref:Uncharacterized protein n=1 Tax=Polarella glacialis TaxID=89957 RepID=A0A813G7Y4_POLGL|nr:unnamed protein product [Polarella glacialis]CAE8650727.1 unnamed protein product [Polarella glacialis]
MRTNLCSNSCRLNACYIIIVRCLFFVWPGKFFYNNTLLFHGLKIKHSMCSACLLCCHHQQQQQQQQQQPQQHDQQQQQRQRQQQQQQQNYANNIQQANTRAFTCS